jgi:ATP-dependent Clp protease adaptor protein ClpS
MSYMNNVQLYEMSKKKSTVKRGKYRVIVHNDDHNTFDHVIDSLMDVCGHGYLQSVQCALIVHEVKQCAVYTDTYEDCHQVHVELRKLGITVTVEKC